jgi:hypothetical protein
MSLWMDYPTGEFRHRSKSLTANSTVGGTVSSPGLGPSPRLTARPFPSRHSRSHYLLAGRARRDGGQSRQSAIAPHVTMDDDYAASHLHGRLLTVTQWLTAQLLR